MFRRVLLCGTLLAVGSAPGQASETQRPLRVLFVGNSYLYTNDLPATVRALAAAHGIAVETTLRAEADFALSDHLRGRRFAALLQQPWDWVLLQQGPSALPESKRELLVSARRVAAHLKGKPTRIALMSAWPAQRNAGMSPRAEASYREAAAAIDACVLPVAAAWRIVGAHASPPRLYQKDGLHPTPIGTLLSAMAVARGLLGVEPVLASPDDAKEAGLFLVLDGAAREAQSQESLRCAPIGAAPIGMVDGG
jgi:hypothetical protein